MAREGNGADFLFQPVAAALAMCVLLNQFIGNAPPHGTISSEEDMPGIVPAEQLPVGFA